MPYQRLPEFIKSATSKFGCQMRRYLAHPAKSAGTAPAQMAHSEETIKTLFKNLAGRVPTKSNLICAGLTSGAIYLYILAINWSFDRRDKSFNRSFDQLENSSDQLNKSVDRHYKSVDQSFDRLEKSVDQGFDRLEKSVASDEKSLASSINVMTREILLEFNAIHIDKMDELDLLKDDQVQKGGRS